MPEKYRPSEGLSTPPSATFPGSRATCSHPEASARPSALGAAQGPAGRAGRATCPLGPQQVGTQSASTASHRTAHKRTRQPDQPLKLQVVKTKYHLRTHSLWHRSRTSRDQQPEWLLASVLESTGRGHSPQSEPVGSILTEVTSDPGLGAGRCSQTALIIFPVTSHGHHLLCVKEAIGKQCFYSELRKKSFLGQLIC